MHRVILRDFLKRLEKSNKGYLLPTILALGIAVSTLGFYTLKVITDNNSTLVNQTYDQLADEAAQAGIQAAIACAKTSTTLWTSQLVPNSANCTGALASPNTSAFPICTDAKSACVYYDATKKIATTYTVTPASPTLTNGTTAITSTGKVAINGTTVATKYARSMLRGLTTADTVTATIAVGTNPKDLIVSPDGSKLFVSNYNSGTISVINTATNTAGTPISISGSKPAALKLSPDGSKLFAASFTSASKVFVINPTTGTLSTTITMPADTYPNAFAMASGTTKFFTANNGNTNDVSRIDTSDNSVFKIATCYQMIDIVIKPNGSEAYASCLTGDKVYAIDTSNNYRFLGIPIAPPSISVGDSPQGMAIKPDGSRVYVANNGSNSVSVINTSTDAIVTTIAVGSAPVKMVVSPDGSRLYVVNYSGGSVSVINTSTNTIATTIPVGSNPTDIAISPDGSKVYTANSSSNSVSIINTTTNAVTTLAVGAWPTALAISPDGSKAYVANYNASNISVITAGASGSVTDINY